MKLRTQISALLAATALICTVAAINLQHASAFGFVESQQIGEFKKLTGEFVQKVINKQESPNSEGVGQFRMLTAQFERDVINAVLNDHLSLIPGLVSQYKSVLNPLELPDELGPVDVDGYTQEVLRIFCKPCI